jgi:hypothetical protein
MRVQWKSRALLAILLIAPLALAGATRAHAQIVITPAAPTSPNTGSGFPVGNPVPGLFALLPGDDYTVTGSEITTGDIFVAPAAAAGAATLNISSGVNITASPAGGIIGPGSTSALVVNGGGQGQPFANSNRPTAITVNIGTTAAPATGVNLTSSGQGVIWLQGPNATLNVVGASPGAVMITGAGQAIPGGSISAGTNQEATAVTVQQGATANITNATLNLNSPPGFQQASEMALCVGGCGLSGSFGPPPNGGNGGNATLNNVVINDTTNTSAGIWASRTGTTLTMTGGSINLLPGSDNSQAVHADINARPVLNNVAITTDGANSVGALARTFEPGNTGIPGGFASGIITLNQGSSITTNGANSTGVLAAGAGLARAGNSTTGAVTSVNPSQIILNGTDAVPIDITTNGMNSTALAVCSCSQVSFSDPFFGPTFVQW